MRIIIQDVKHLKIKQDLLWVGTATLATVVIWIGYAIYMAFNVTTVDPAVKKLLTPLNPSLDQQALTILDNRFIPPDNFTPIVTLGDNNHRVPNPPRLASPSASRK
jgi:hypothetical protein